MNTGINCHRKICSSEEHYERQEGKRFVLQLGFPFVGLLPIRKNILAKRLWRDCPSSLAASVEMRRPFLEASLHLDNYVALPTVGREQEDDGVGDGFLKACFLGCVLEAVRCILQTSSDNVNWTPPIETGRRLALFTSVSNCKPALPHGRCMELRRRTLQSVYFGNYNRACFIELQKANGRKHQTSLPCLRP